MRLIDNAKRDFHRFWVIRISLAYGIFMGVNCVLGAFFEVFNPWFLLTVAVIVNVALIPMARIVQQDPHPDDAKPTPAPPAVAP